VRYSISSKSLPVDEIEKECQLAGGSHIAVARAVKQVFCELPSSGISVLQSRGMIVKPLKTLKATQIAPPELFAIDTVLPATDIVATPGMGLDIGLLIHDFRAAFEPAVTGVGLTVAILDTGIRKTHESIGEDKVVYEEDFSESGSVDDIFGHGTGVAYLVAGGSHGGENSGMAPGAKLINLKCLGDDGNGSDETVIAAISKVCDLVTAAAASGYPKTHEEYPNIVNLSVGTEDDGEEDNPVKLACKVARDDYGLQLLAAAGNDGPEASTIMLPATSDDVISVGGLSSAFFQVWEYSGRGPTLDGLVKPDFVAWATDLFTAGHTADDSYVLKTGTSFATPILTGLIGLLWEVGRRNYGSDWEVTWYDVRNVGWLVCGKAEDAPAEKDNSWGFGLPAIAEMVRGAQVEPAEFGLTSVMGIVMVMMILGTVMAMSRGK